MTVSDQENAALTLVHALTGDSWGIQEAAVNTFGSVGFTAGLQLMINLGTLLREYLPEEVKAQFTVDLRQFLADARAADERPPSS